MIVAQANPTIHSWCPKLCPASSFQLLGVAARWNVNSTPWCHWIGSTKQIHLETSCFFFMSLPLNLRGFLEVLVINPLILAALKGPSLSSRHWWPRCKWWCSVERNSGSLGEMPRPGKTNESPTMNISGKHLTLHDPYLSVNSQSKFWCILP